MLLMYKALGILIFINISLGHTAEDVDLGVIGAKGSTVRFGSRYDPGPNKIKDYLKIIGERRNTSFLELISEEDSTDYKNVNSAEDRLIRSILED
jgi:hypothetical protein